MIIWEIFKKNDGIFSFCWKNRTLLRLSCRGAFDIVYFIQRQMFFLGGRYGGAS